MREETIQGWKLVSKKASKGRKLFKGGSYIRADTIQGNTVSIILTYLPSYFVEFNVTSSDSNIQNEFKSSLTFANNIDANTESTLRHIND